MDDMDNRTLNAIYDFYFEKNNSTASDYIESQNLSNIAFMVVIIALISFILIIALLTRTMKRSQEIPMEDAVLMIQIKELRNAMNPSELNTPDDPFSFYQMRNNRTPKNTSDHGSGCQEVGFVN